MSQPPTTEESTWQLIRAALRGGEPVLTSGSIRRAVWLLAIPMVLEMLGEGIFALVDAYFVSKISNAAVTAVGLTETVVTIVYALAVGVSVAATALVSRRTGEGQPEAAGTAAVQAILLGVGIALVVGVGGVWQAENILYAMGATEEVVRSGMGYTRILLGSNLVILLLFILNGIFRGAGDAAVAMRALWVANGLNIVLDPLLIFGYGAVPAFGVEGAAMATTIGRGLGVAFQLHMLFRGTDVIRLSRRQLRVAGEAMRSILNVASTGFIQYFIASASWIFLMRIVAQSGPDVTAGYVYAVRILLFTILPSWGLANAAATLVGQNLGAGQPGRAEASAWRAAYYNLAFLGVLTVIYFLFTPQLIGIFTEDPVSLQAGVTALRYFTAGNIFYAFSMVLSQAFSGAGDTRTPTLINFVAFWLIEIPLAYYLGDHLEWGLSGVCLAVVIAEIVLTVLCVYLFRRGRWKLTNV